MSTAMEYLNGNRKWYINGRLHRENDLPAISNYDDDTKKWYLNGKRHRLNGLPAVEFSDGDKEWWLFGERHRLGGLPAIDYKNNCDYVEYDKKEWWIYGKEYSYKRVCKFYRILVKFGRLCLRKIRIRQLRKAKYIHNELLFMPSTSKYHGGQCYHKMVNHFMIM